MKKQIMITIIFLSIVAVSIVGYIKLNETKVVNPIDNVILSYKNYKFYDLGNNNDLFKLKKLVVKYDMTKESSVIKINDKSISAYLIDDILHIMVDDIDYKYPDLGEINRLMFYKWCNCNSDCYRLVLLTEEGVIYYLDLNDSVNYEDPSILKKFNDDKTYKNIGYVENLNIDSKCGVNGLVLVDETDDEIVFDSELKKYEQTYYKYIKIDNHILYVYPNGYISLDNFDKSTSRYKEIFISNDKIYLIGIDSKLYVLDFDNNIKSMSNKIISKIGRNKDELIVVFSDATAIKLNVKSVLK